MNIFTKYWLRLKWKQQNYQPPIEKSDEEHVCPFCNEPYSGNYCPQCGLQYGRDRFTWKTVSLNLMDLWGIGNRNVFLTIGHLMWRPGYLIHDFLRSKHRAYFPPIPLLVATCLLFTLMVSTLHITWDKDLDAIYDMHTPLEEGQSGTVGRETFALSIEKKDEAQEAKKGTKKDAKEEKEDKQNEKLTQTLSNQILSLENLMKAERQWSRDNIAYSLIISNLLVILLASWIFRQSPRIQLSTVESFYVQMYIACQMMLIAIPYTLITWEICESSFLPYPLPSLLSFAILVVDYHQLCGYSLWGTIWRLIALGFNYTIFGTIVAVVFTVIYLVFPVITDLTIILPALLSL